MSIVLAANALDDKQIAKKRMINLMEKKPPVIIAENIVKKISTQSKNIILLQDINLKIHASETVAICGPSGVGKSTLLGIIANLDEPSSGKLHILNHDVSTLSENERSKLRANNISFIFQSFYLLPMLTALENVMLPLEIVGIKNAKQQASNILERVQLQARLSHYPHQLSGGEQQRVAIARAYVTNPKLLFADEITGSLDEENGQIITDLLFELNQDHNTTLIIVTHDNNLASKCQRILTLKNGSLHES
ncbi:MAG: putative ABC transporter ATP-binding protein YknY [Legionellaceae bacterium]